MVQYEGCKKTPQTHKKTRKPQNPHTPKTQTLKNTLQYKKLRLISRIEWLWFSAEHPTSTSMSLSKIMR